MAIAWMLAQDHHCLALYMRIGMIEIFFDDGKKLFINIS